MKKKKRYELKPCPHCGINMRRIYIQQRGYNKNGKRIGKFIPIGNICFICTKVEMDFNKRGK